MASPVKEKEAALDQVHQWAQRTTIEGLPNLTLPGSSLLNRAFWSGALLIVTVIGLVHLVMSMINFANSGVYSKMYMDAAVAEFPDVTVCTLKPASEAVLGYYDSLVNNHMDTHWSYFDNWFAEERRLRLGESTVAYQNRLAVIFRSMIEILWASDDIKDLGLTDVSAIVDCSYNGVACDHRNFTLVQHYQYWNCYTFHPNPQSRVDSEASGGEESGFSLSLFTDNNYFQSAYRTSSSYRSDPKDYATTGMSLRSYLTGNSPDEFPLNSIMGSSYQSDGVLIVLHPSRTYPIQEQVYNTFILQNGMSATCHIETVKRTRLSWSGYQCSNEPPDQVQVNYVAHFGAQADSAHVRAFVREPSDVVNERFQEEVQSLCDCYSHKFPYPVNNSKLCYYATASERKTPSPRVLKRIACHDAWFTGALRDLSMGKHSGESEQPCQRIYREVNTDTTEWPSDEELEPAATTYFYKWLSGTSLVKPGRRQHRVLNITEEVAKTLPKDRPWISRERLSMRSLLKPECRNSFLANITDMRIRSLVTQCLDRERARRNLLQINVRLASNTLTEYRDEFVSDNFEILSEIGGVLGLWFGISLMTAMELVELFCMVALSRRRRTQLEWRQQRLQFLKFHNPQLPHLDSGDLLYCRSSRVQQQKQQQQQQQQPDQEQKQQDPANEKSANSCESGRAQAKQSANILELDDLLTLDFLSDRQSFRTDLTPLSDPQLELSDEAQQLQQPPDGEQKPKEKRDSKETVAKTAA